MNEALAFAATRGKVDFSCLVMSYCSQQIKCKKKPLGRIILTDLTRLEKAIEIRFKGLGIVNCLTFIQCVVLSSKAFEMVTQWILSETLPETIESGRLFLIYIYFFKNFLYVT